MNREFSDYGLWPLVAINSLIFIVFAFSFFRPKTARDWRSFGAFSAFLIALFTEMYGFPLTIYLLSGWLTSHFPGVDWYAHDSGHLLEMMFGWGGNPHVGPFHLLSSVFVFGGLILLAAAWRVLYRAQRAHELAQSGPYALVRHPQYTAFISIMFGFLLQWPTLPTVVMFPILVLMYRRLAQSEEREALAWLGNAYRDYVERTPAFLPSFANTLRLGGAVAFVFGLPLLLTYVLVQPPSLDAGSKDERTKGADSGNPMLAAMDRIRSDFDALSSQMRALNGAADPAVRSDLVLAHFDALRRINQTVHEMNSTMVDDVNRGKIVADTGLKQRLQLDAEVMKMQLDMLEAQAHGAPTGAAARDR